MLIKLALGLTLLSPGPQDVSPVPPPAAQDAAVCLSPDPEWMGFLGYPKNRRFIPYQYASTGVPNSSMQGEPYESVLFLSNSGHHALLVFVLKLADGRLVALNDGYLMRKTSQGWKASEGNGGPGMYARVEKFVSDLNRTPPYVLDRKTEAGNSCISEEEYNKQPGMSSK